MSMWLIITQTTLGYGEDYPEAWPIQCALSIPPLNALKIWVSDVSRVEQNGQIGKKWPKRQGRLKKTNVHRALFPKKIGKNNISKNLKIWKKLGNQYKNYVSGTLFFSQYIVSMIRNVTQYDRITPCLASVSSLSPIRLLFSRFLRV